MTCENHDDLVRELATNTSTTQLVLFEVRAVAKKLDHYAQRSDQRGGAIDLVKTMVPWFLASIGASVALATLITRIV